MATSKRKPKTGRSKEAKSATRIDKHAEQCSVCKHPQRLEIEARYLYFESEREVEADYELSDSALHRHVAYYGLNRKRVEDTERVLESLVGKGMSQLKDVPVTVVLDAVRELHKVRGRHKQEGKNPDDVKREADDKVWAEAQLKEYMETYGVSREQALLDVQKLAPTISECLH